MSVSLTNNFTLNARGLTYGDTASVTWSFNKNTNTLSANVAGSPTGANPTAKVGSAVVNGSALTWMRSDAAPPIDLTVNYTWTGAHTWSDNTKVQTVAGRLAAGPPASGNGHLLAGNYETTNPPAAGAHSGLMNFLDPTGKYGVILGTLNTGAGYIQAQRVDGTATTYTLNIQFSGGATVLGGQLAINGGTPTAALTGFGSPVGTPTSGLTNAATLAQTAGTLAALLAYLKTIGVIAA